MLADKAIRITGGGGSLWQGFRRRRIEDMDIVQLPPPAGFGGRAQSF